MECTDDIEMSILSIILTQAVDIYCFSDLMDD